MIGTAVDEICGTSSSSQCVFSNESTTIASSTTTSCPDGSDKQCAIGVAVALTLMAGIYQVSFSPLLQVT